MDIQHMLKAINEFGLSQQQIADKVGASQPTIHRAMNGGSAITYETGKKIESLYNSLFPAKAA